MSTITIKNTVTGKIIATGKLGSDVQNFEGNYYFKRDLVDLSEAEAEEKAYTCPIKRASCDYYFFKDQNRKNFSREACWIYGSIPNELYKSIEGWVGFYTKPSQNGLEVSISENE